MDTSTHSLIGAAVSDGWFRQRLGPAATPFALAVSALPDADMAAYFISPEYGWANHRGYSHSLLPMLLAAPLLGYAGHRLSRRTGEWGWWTLLALICLFGHTFLDLATSWGTMPLLPFSNARMSWDVIPILDLFLTATSAASFVANRLLRREKVETFVNPLAYPVVRRHPGRQRLGGRTGKAAAVLMMVYMLIGWQQNRQVVREAEKALAALGVEAVEVRALPLLFTYVASGIAARDGGGTVYNAVYSSYAPKPMRFTARPGLSSPDVERVLASPDGRMFAWYTQNMFTAGRGESGGGSGILLSDWRFFLLSPPRASRFVMTFDATADGGPKGVRAARPERDGSGLGEEFMRLWHLTRHGEAADGDDADSGDIPARSQH